MKHLSSIKKGSKILAKAVTPLALALCTAAANAAVTLEIVSQPASGTGTASVVNGNELQYTPPANWSGTTSFTYRAVDGSGAYSSVQTATVNVASVNDAPVAGDLTFSLDEDSSQTQTLSVTDIDGAAPFTGDVVSQPANGFISVSGTDFTFTPDPNWNGTTTFQYRVADADGAQSSIKTGNITVNPLPDPVSSSDLAKTADEDNAIAFNIPINDADIGMPSDSHVVSITQQPLNGTLSVTGNVVTFTPNSDWNGTDSFNFKVTDSTGNESSVHTASITMNAINDAPVGSDLNMVTDEDVDVTEIVSFSDVDAGDTHSLEIVTQPANGQVIVRNAGPGQYEIEYRPASHWNGTDTFTYRYKDDSGDYSSTYTGIVLVNPINDDPSGDWNTDVDEDSFITLAPTITDPDLPDMHTITVSVDPNKGTATTDGTSITYTPNPDYEGNDSFRYVITDSAGSAVEEIASVRVTPLPDAPKSTSAPDMIAKTNSTGNPVTPVVIDVDGGESFTFAITRQSSLGTVNVIGGKFVFTAGNAPGYDTIDYRVTDKDGLTIDGTANVATNTTPVVESLEITIDEDENINGFTVKITDPDPGDSFTSQILVDAVNGSFSINEDRYTYRPNLNWNGSEEITIQATDSMGAVSAPATIKINVTPINDTPSGAVLSITTDEDVVSSPVAVVVTDVDMDYEGDSHTFSIFSQPKNGSVVMNGDGTFTYTPELNWYGTEEFKIRVTDQAGANILAIADVTVNPTPDMPLSASGNIEAFTEQPSFVFNLIVDDPDGESDSHSVTAIKVDPSRGVAVIADGEIIYTGNAGVDGADSLTAEVSDSTGNKIDAIISITVHEEFGFGSTSPNDGL